MSYSDKCLENGKNEAVLASIGKTITALELNGDDALVFTFSDGAKLKVFDAGQNCCESRYMRTDDKLAEFVGSTLVGFDVKDAPDMDDGNGDVHEVSFLQVNTSAGDFTMSSHNEHNGYYGGFAIAAVLV